MMKGITILVVEDEENLRKLIKAYLQKEGFRVLEAADGDVSMEWLISEKVDLVILDIMLPNSDGWSVCKKIRESSGIPVLMLTARSQEQDKLFGFELGADDYMTKPFSVKELVARTKALLKRSKKEEEIKDILEINDLLIDKKSHRVFLKGEPVELNPKEYDLLLFFVINKNLALTREMILDGVWGFDYYGDLRTVDTHVKRLRQKMGGAGEYITTLRGTGYRFEVLP